MRSWQAGIDHVHGVWLQCRRRYRLPHYPLSPRKTDSHHYQQFRPLQRTVPCTDRSGHHIHSRGSRAIQICSRCSDSAGYDRSGRDDHTVYFKSIVQDHSEGTSVFFHAGASTIPETPAGKDPDPVAAGQDSVRTGPCCRSGGTRRAGDLAHGKYHCGQHQSAGSQCRIP